MRAGGRYFCKLILVEIVGDIFNNTAAVQIMRECLPGYDLKMQPLVNAIAFLPLFSVLLF